MDNYNDMNNDMDMENMLDMTEQNNEPIPYEELVDLLQSGMIGFLQFVMNGKRARQYLEWCMSLNLDANNDSAEYFLEMTEIDMLEHMYMDDESVGIWN